MKNLLSILLLLCLAICTQAAEKSDKFICCDTALKKLMIIENGKITWEYKVDGKPVDVSVLTNGNILFCCDIGFVREINLAKETVWEYKAEAASSADTAPEAADKKKKGKKKKANTIEFQSVQRLADGSTLIGNNTAKKLLIVNKDKKIIKAINIQSNQTNSHKVMRRARQGADGNFYVAQHDGAYIYNSEGKLIKKFPKKDWTYQVIPLPNGEVAATGHNEMVIFDKDGKEIWKLNGKDIKGKKVLAITGVQLLSNGNFFIASWLGHGNVGKGVPAFEISRDKKIHWTFEDNKNTKMITGAVRFEP